jgi:hypothetical protein
MADQVDPFGGFGHDPLVNVARSALPLYVAVVPTPEHAADPAARHDREETACETVGCVSPFGVMCECAVN